jgi:receptor expression-enhancing protein 1/2/3/4
LFRQKNRFNNSLQGSTYIYNTYLQPFFLKNESQLDAGIISIQRNTLIFLQARLSALWEAVWGIINKSPATGQTEDNIGPTNPNRPPALSLQSAIGLWNTYGSSLLSTFQPSGAARSVETSASTSATTPGIAAEHRAPYTPDQEPNLPNPFAAPPLNSSPPFPEPQHA